MSSPAPFRKKRKVDEDIIYTEKDTRKATGADDENDFVEEEEHDNDNIGAILTSKSDILMKKHNMRIVQAAQDVEIAALLPAGAKTKFRFLNLPPEVRNMIYRYLLVSKARKLRINFITRRAYLSPDISPISLSNSGRKSWLHGGIDTTILLINHQVSILSDYTK